MKKTVKTRITTDIVMFLSSYTPLFIILFIKDMKDTIEIQTPLKWSDIDLLLNHPYWSAGLLSISIFSFLIVCIFKFYSLSKQRGGQKIYINSIEIIKTDMINFCLPFLVGLIGLDYSSWQNRACVVFFLIFMFLIIRKLEVTFFNPMLTILGVGHAKITYCNFGDKEKQFKVDIIGNIEVLNTYNSNSNPRGDLKELSGISLLR
jgi:hypothetical protein